MAIIYQGKVVSDVHRQATQKTFENPVLISVDNVCTWKIPHNLNNNVIYSLRNKDTGKIVTPYSSHIYNNDLVLKFASNSDIPASTYVVNIMTNSLLEEVNNQEQIAGNKINEDIKVSAFSCHNDTYNNYLSGPTLEYVGKPNVTRDGVLVMDGKPSFVATKNKFTNPNSYPWEVYIRFKHDITTPNQYFLVGRDNGPALHLYIDSYYYLTIDYGTGNDWLGTHYTIDYTLEKNVYYRAKVSFDGISTYTMSLYSDKEVLIGSINNTFEGIVASSGSNSMLFGSARTITNFFVGEIDLRSSYIKLNDSYFFNGLTFGDALFSTSNSNKLTCNSADEEYINTSVQPSVLPHSVMQTSYSTNYNVVGSVTVSSAHVASGFAQNNYLVANVDRRFNKFTAGTVTSMDIQFKVAIGSSYTSNGRIFNWDVKGVNNADSIHGPYLELQSNGKVNLRWYDDSSYYGVEVCPNASLNTTYWFKVLYFSGRLIGLYSTDGVNWTRDGLVTTNNVWFYGDCDFSIGGRMIDKYTGCVFNGSVYLDDCYVDVNGERLWGCNNYINTNSYNVLVDKDGNSTIARTFIQSNVPSSPMTNDIWYKPNDKVYEYKDNTWIETTKAVCGPANVNTTGYVKSASAYYPTSNSYSITNVEELKQNINCVKNIVPNYAFPSNKTKQYAISSRETTYIAPADGWFCLAGTHSGSQSFVYVEVHSSNGTKMTNESIYRGSYSPKTSVYVRISKGQEVFCGYYGINSPTVYFTYANGAI